MSTHFYEGGGGGGRPERDSQSGESIGRLSLPHGVWPRKCEGGERLARAQHHFSCHLMLALSDPPPPGLLPY